MIMCRRQQQPVIVTASHVAQKLAFRRPGKAAHGVLRTRGGHLMIFLLELK